MTSQSSFRNLRFAAWLVVGLFAALELHAQTGGFGGFGGFGGTGFGGATGTGSSSTRSRSRTSYAAPGEIGDAVISIDNSTRSLVVIADERTKAYIKQVIANLDRPKPQVLIKVVFMEVTHNNDSDIGIEGGAKGTGPNDEVGALTHAFGLSAIGNSVSSNLASSVTRYGQSPSSFTPNGAGLYSIMAENYEVTLRAIAHAGKAKVLSRPSIVALNNQPATITVGQSVPLITDVRFDSYGNAINSVSYQSVGIILRVTPFITSDGMVEMIVSPEISELVQDRSQWVPISNGASAPLINSRSADTVVVTPDGQTVIIGGLMHDSDGSSETKIPILGDIPLLGNLFKRQVKNKSKVELMIFLTPQIIRAPSEMASFINMERAKSDAAKSMSKDLDKYLDNLPLKSAEPGSPAPKQP